MVDERLIPKKIRQLRLERNMTQQDLANAIGVTKGYISRMENAESAPPVGTLIALAQAFKVELNTFFEAEDPEVYVTVTKRGQRPPVARDHMADAQYEHLALQFPKRAFESYFVKVSGPIRKSMSNQHKGQELIFVLKGTVEFNINGQPHKLEEGDAIHFNSSYPHFGTCHSEQGVELLAIIYNSPDNGDLSLDGRSEQNETATE